MCQTPFKVLLVYYYPHFTDEETEATAAQSGFQPHSWLLSSSQDSYHGALGLVKSKLEQMSQPKVETEQLYIPLNIMKIHGSSQVAEPLTGQKASVWKLNFSVINFSRRLNTGFRGFSGF